jgi:hypothetical protein
MSARRSIVPFAHPLHLGVVGCLVAVAALAADDPVERWAKAVGGRDKVAPIRAIYREATIQVGPYAGSLKVWHTAAGSYRKEEAIGPQSVVEIFDGEAATLQVAAQPPRRLTDAELALVRSKAYANWNAVFFAFFPERRHGELVVEGDGTIVLKPQGGVDWRVTLDPVTGLPKTMVHQEGPQTITVDYVAYESVGGLQLEKEIHRSNGDPRFDAVIRFTKTVVDPTFDPSLLSVDPHAAPRAASAASSR